MAEQIVIAELQLNTKSLQDSNAKLIQQIAELKTQQKDLQKETNNLTTATEEQSRKFIENDATLKQLNTEYSNNKKVLAEVQTGITGLNDELEKEVKSVYEATTQNAKLNIIKKQITTSTQEGRDAIAEINKKLDENTAYIKENSSEFEKQKMNIGNYKESIKGAFQDLNIFNGGLTGFMQRSQDAGGTGKLLTESFKGIMTGVKGATLAAWEFIATPIGAIIAAIVIVATLLYDIFKNFAPVINPIKDAMAALGAVFETVKSSIFALITGTKSLGEIFSSFGGEVSKAADEAYKLAAANREILKDQRELELSTARYSAEITKLMVQSRNRTLSEQERIDLLDKAIKLEKQKVDEELTLNNKRIAAARMTLAEGKQISEEDMEQLAKGNATYAQSIKKKYGLDQEYIDNLRKLQVERYAIIEADSRVAEKAQNFRDKNEDNMNAKREKAIADAKKAREDEQKAIEKAQESKIKLMNEELSLFIAQENLKKKSALEEIDFIYQVSKKKQDILAKELEFGKISQQKYDEEILKINEESGKQQTQRIIDRTKAELDLFIATNVTKIESGKLLTQEIVNEEAKRLEVIKNDKLKIIEEEKKTNQSLIDEKIANNERLTNSDLEFLTEKANVENEFNKQNQANAKALEDQFKAEKTAQLQADNEIALANAQTQLDANLLQIEQSYEAELQLLDNKLKKQQLTQEQYDAKVIQADKKKKQMMQLAELNDTQSKLNEYKKLGEGLAGLFGKNKLIASALAGVNTALGVTEILKTPSVLPEPMASISRAVQIGTTIATGIKSVAEINGAKFAKGIIDIDGPGTSTSDSIPSLLSKGESVIKADSTAKYKDLLYAINNDTLAKDYAVPYASNFSNSTYQSTYSYSNNQQMDVDLLAFKIGTNVAEANKNLPTPVLPLEDFHKANDNYLGVVSGANH